MVLLSNITLLIKHQTRGLFYLRMMVMNVIDLISVFFHSFVHSCESKMQSVQTCSLLCTQIQ